MTFVTYCQESKFNVVTVCWTCGLVGKLTDFWREKPLGKWPFGKEMDYKNGSCMDLAQYYFQWQTLTLDVLNFHILLPESRSVYVWMYVLYFLTNLNLVIDYVSFSLYCHTTHILITVIYTAETRFHYHQQSQT